MTPLSLVLAGAAGSAAADFGDQDPRGLTHTVIGSLVVRGNRLAISNSSSLSGCELHGSSLRARLPAADFGDQVDLALGFQRDEVGVLEDFAVDRHRHALLDLAPEAGEAAVEPEDDPAEIVGLSTSSSVSPPVNRGGVIVHRGPGGLNGFTSISSARCRMV